MESKEVVSTIPGFHRDISRFSQFDVVTVLASGTLGIATSKKAKWHGMDNAERKLCLFLQGIDANAHGCEWRSAVGLRVKAAWIDDGKAADKRRYDIYFKEGH